jgi:predicted nuclease with TOPRIM domain
MEDQNTIYADVDKREENSRKMLVLVIISVLIGFNGFLLWQFFDKKAQVEEVTKTLETTSAERDALSAELQRVKSEYDKINQENTGLLAQVTAKDEEIKAKMAEIKRLIDSGDAVQLQKAKNELAQLKALNQGYLAELDSARSYSRSLVDQNQSLNTTLADANNKLNSLKQENTSLASKVAVASMLKTGNVTALGVRYKNNGKEIESPKAAATQKIKTCFNILENIVASPGNKDIFVRILTPDGSVLTNGSETFMVQGQASLYTVKETFEYSNKETNICMYWEKGSAYASGTYTAEIYCDGSLIGNSSFELK